MLGHGQTVLMESLEALAPVPRWGTQGKLVPGRRHPTVTNAVAVTQFQVAKCDPCELAALKAIVSGTQSFGNELPLLGARPSA